MDRHAHADRYCKAAPRASQPARTDLPEEVVALASRLGASPHSPTNCVQLTQAGAMRLAPDSADRLFTASQTLCVQEVGFTWRAHMRFVGPISVQVTEGLDRGEGYLDVRLLGMVRLAHVKGGDLAFQGEATRYLAELVWNPDAILFNRDLEWRVLDHQSLLVAIRKDERRAEVRLRLDGNGDPILMEADARPRQVGRAMKMTPWFGRCEGYEWYGGRRIPRQGEAGWNLSGESFVYWRSRIETWSIS